MYLQFEVINGGHHLFLMSVGMLQLVGIYCRWMIPGLLPFVFSLVIVKVISYLILEQIKQCHWQDESWFCVVFLTANN